MERGFVMGAWANPVSSLRRAYIRFPLIFRDTRGGRPSLVIRRARLVTVLEPEWWPEPKAAWPRPKENEKCRES